MLCGLWEGECHFGWCAARPTFIIYTCTLTFLASSFHMCNSLSIPSSFTSSCTSSCLWFKWSCHLLCHDRHTCHKQVLGLILFRHHGNEPGLIRHLCHDQLPGRNLLLCLSNGPSLVLVLRHTGTKRNMTVCDPPWTLISACGSYATSTRKSLTLGYYFACGRRSVSRSDLCVW